MWLKNERKVCSDGWLLNGAVPLQKNGDRCHSTFYEILQGFAQVETGSATRSRFEIKMRRSPSESFELVFLMNALKAIVEGRGDGSEEIKLNFLKGNGGVSRGFGV